MWSRNPYNSQTMGWVNFHVTEKVWENRNISQVLLYLPDLELMKTHVWECATSHNTKIICGKPYRSQAVGFWKILKTFYPFHEKLMGIPISFPLTDFERFFLLIHTIPKTWGKWIPIVRKKYGKTQTFEVFLKHFVQNRNPCYSQRMW